MKRFSPQSSKNSDWGASDGWDDWEAGEKPLPEASKVKAKESKKDEDDWDSWGPDSLATNPSNASGSAMISPTKSGDVSNGAKNTPSPSLSKKAASSNFSITTPSPSTKKSTTLDDDLWNLDDWETLPLDKGDKVATKDIGGNGIVKTDPVDNLGFEDMKITKPIEKKNSGLDDLLGKCFCCGQKPGELIL